MKIRSRGDINSLSSLGLKVSSIIKEVTECLDIRYVLIDSDSGLKKLCIQNPIKLKNSKVLFLGLIEVHKKII